MKIELELELSYEPGMKSGRLHLMVEGVEITDSDTGEQIGAIRPAVGGGIVIIRGETTWFLDYAELWQAVATADEARQKSKGVTDERPD